MLLERKQLTSGTTWHAAGLVGQLQASQNRTRLAKYSADLYARLEAETGLATGFRQCGSMTVALSAERREEILRLAAMARAFGVEVNELIAGRGRGDVPAPERRRRRGRRASAEGRPGRSRRTSRWRSPRERACAARASSRA